MISDAAGNLYGTTFLGGLPCPGHVQQVSGCGTVYELSQPAVTGDPWQETTLYRFTGGKDGANPVAALHLDKAGNLYGTTYQGGLKNPHSKDNGAVFELSPPAVLGGTWTETTLHDFGGSFYHDGGEFVDGGLVRVGGKLYGTTGHGGSTGLGTAYSLVVTP